MNVYQIQRYGRVSRAMALNEVMVPIVGCHLWVSSIRGVQSRGDCGLDYVVTCAKNARRKKHAIVFVSNNRSVS